MLHKEVYDKLPINHYHCTHCNKQSTGKCIIMSEDYLLKTMTFIYLCSVCEEKTEKIYEQSKPL